MTEDHDSPHCAIVRRHLAIAEAACAEGSARISRQRELVIRGIGTELGEAEQRLSQLVQTQAQLERRRDQLKARLAAPLGVPNAAA